MQVAAVCFVALLVVATFAGCAKYNGDKAVFCADLAEAPSFAKLSAEVNSGSPRQASERMARAAATFRNLERAAPRSIRDKVASLGNSAERIAHNLKPGSPDTTQVVYVPQKDGSVLHIPLSGTSQDRIGVFYSELENHHGTVEAMYSLVTYAQNKCGISPDDVNLGMMGYGPATQGTPGSPAPLQPDNGMVPPNGMYLGPPSASTLPPVENPRPPSSQVPTTAATGR